jgi:hypothetical protein
MNFPPSGTDVAIGLAAFLLGWYVVGLQIGRKRAGKLVRQIRDSIQSFGGNATIRWIGRSACRIEVEHPATAPLSKLTISMLLEPRETFLLWILGRCFGRRDWLIVSAHLNGSVKGIFEVYRSNRRGAFDSKQAIKELGWPAAPLPARRELVLAAPGPDGQALAEQVLALFRGADVWRVRVRNVEPQLSISVPVPARESRVPLPVFSLLLAAANLVLAGQPRPGAESSGR